MRRDGFQLEPRPPAYLADRCVAPSSDPSINTDVDSEFAWSYRADSIAYPQATYYLNNFAYARITGATGAVVTAQTFNNVFNTPPVLVVRHQMGRYTVTLKNLNPIYGNVVHGYLHNVIVQRTCVTDSAAACLRSVCIPYSWTPGLLADTTVDVRCYGPNGNGRDTDFKVFVGDEAQNSQTMTESANYGLGWRFGWLAFTNQTSNTCYTPQTFAHRSQHEGPAGAFPSLAAPKLDDSLIRFDS